MSVPAGYEPKAYISDGSLSPRSIEWPFIDASNIFVAVDGVAKVLNVDYQIVGAYPSARILPLAGFAKNGQSVEYRRATPPKQDYRINQPALDRVKMERELDRQTLVQQEVSAEQRREADARLELADRAILLPIGEVATVLPPAAKRRGDAVLSVDPVTKQLSLRPASYFGSGPRGPQGYAVRTLDQLRAAPVTDGPLNYDRAPWEFIEGDFSTTPPSILEVHVVASDLFPLSVGAWVRQGASNVAAKRAEAGAVTLTQQARNDADAFNLFEFIPTSLHAGIIGRTVNNNKAAAEALAGYIQEAIDKASAKRRALIVPAGLYNVAPIVNFAAEAGPLKRCFAIRSHMDIVAEFGATFRIVNGISTDGAPQFMCMFGTNERLNDVSWYGLKMDMNGQNNPISPNRGTGVYSLVNQAQIHVTGTPGGNAAWINDATVEHCWFVNTPGVSCLVTGQSNVVDSGIGSNWLVSRCKFKNNGLDTIDHSSVYAWANNVSCINCRFDNDDQFDVVGGLVAYEIHGANADFSNNRVRNYFQGVWLDGNSSEEVFSPIVSGNVLEKIGAFGIIMFGQSSTASPVIGALIEGNQIELDDTPFPGIDLKYGVGTFGLYSQKDVRVKGNRIRGLGAVTAKAGVVVAAGTIAGQKHDRWQIEGNTFDNLVIGVAPITNATAGLGTIDIKGNIAINLTPQGAFDVPQGVAVTAAVSRIDDLSIVGNTCIDDRDVPLCAFAIRVEGPVNRYTLYDNRARDMVESDYEEVNFTALKRKGRFTTSIDYDPAPLAAGAMAFADISVPGAEMSDRISVTMSAQLNGVLLTAEVHSPGFARVYFFNGTGAEVNIASTTLFATLEKMP